MVLPARPRRAVQFPGWNVHSAPLPSFRRIALGSIVQLSLVRLSKFDPAAPSDGMPASASVAKISLAVEPFTVLVFLPKVTSQFRTVMSTLPARQTIRSAVTTIGFLYGMSLLAANSIAIAFFSAPERTDDSGAITPAS